MGTITKESLLKKGFNEKQTELILNSNIAFSKLKEKDDLFFIEKFREEATEIMIIVRKSKRPPIPRDIQNKLMYESNRCCCICKDANKGVVIHHISPWEESFSHKEENLAVLCCAHHAEAHIGLIKSVDLLTDKLIPSKVKSMKKMWVTEVKARKKEVIKGVVNQKSGYWLYFNPNIWMFIISNNIHIEKNNHYLNLFNTNIICEEGYFTEDYMALQNDKNIWIHSDLKVSIPIRQFYNSIISNLVLDYEVLDLNSKDFSYLNNLNGRRLFIYKGKFSIKNDDSRYNKTDIGRGRIRRANTESYENVNMEFVFDEYNTMSDSAQYSHLRGRHKYLFIFGEIRSIEKRDNKVYISPTVYAIATGYP